MTPEQRAAAPAHPLPFIPLYPAEHKMILDRIGTISKCIRDYRIERWNLEYPPGHEERLSKVPQWVLKL